MLISIPQSYFEPIYLCMKVFEARFRIPTTYIPTYTHTYIHTYLPTRMTKLQIGRDNSLSHSLSLQTNYFSKFTFVAFVSEFTLHCRLMSVASPSFQPPPPVRFIFIHILDLNARCKSASRGIRTGLTHIIKPLSGWREPALSSVFSLKKGFAETEQERERVRERERERERITFIQYLYNTFEKDVHFGPCIDGMKTCMHTKRRCLVLLRIKCSSVQFLFLWHSAIPFFHFFRPFFQLR